MRRWMHTTKAWSWPINHKYLSALRWWPEWHHYKSQWDTSLPEHRSSAHSWQRLGKRSMKFMPRFRGTSTMIETRQKEGHTNARELQQEALERLNQVERDNKSSWRPFQKKCKNLEHIWTQHSKARHIHPAYFNQGYKSMIGRELLELRRSADLMWNLPDA